jgi:hypothetical protein
MKTVGGGTGPLEAIAEDQRKYTRGDIEEEEKHLGDG